MRPALLLFLACCSAPYEAPSTFPSTDFTSQEAGIAEQAAFEWNPYLVPQKRVICDLPTCWVGSYPWMVLRKAPEHGYVGWTGWSDGPLIEIAPFLSNEEKYLVFKHELGHAIGIIQHTQTGVMATEVSSPDINAEVLAACKRVKACHE